MLLEALGKVELQELNVKLLLAGEFYGDEDLYQSLIQKYGLQDRVYLHTSFIPNDEVGKYFCAADVVVLPYRTATQSGITQVAYHFDLPMIVTRVGGLPELVHDGLVGTVVEPNVAEIVKGIASFYDQNKGSVFRENMKEEKKKYSWDIFGEEIIRLAK
ncbi:glycosyltransferase [Sphingobacterium sp. IITKGP-BTPF85]|nr:glycosyltransferase [Sphingobacterium sp. IITKGP-BTPF85]KKX48515.1 hypothetical protein L950_0220710 [Sphingobacterium sp. IITKGP-BTPF85]